MSVIWKYSVRTTAEFEKEMPEGARILSLQIQRDGPYMWAQVDNSKPLVARRFRVFATGEPIDDSLPLAFIGTYQLPTRENLVFHLFELL
jgi:hypothetical protein